MGDRLPRLQSRQCEIDIKRDIEATVKQAISEYPAVLLTGPRQCGKTTMLEKIFENAPREYVTLDDVEARNLAKNDPPMFFQLHKPPIFIDEVQYAPELFPYVKMIADRRKTPGDFVMTGSQMFKLMKLAGESLAGRVAILHMLPLSQHEIFASGAAMSCAAFTIDIDSLIKRKDGSRQEDVNGFFERIWKGSMPGIISGKFTNRDVFYRSYINTYLERDIKEVEAVDFTKFYRFLVSCASRTANMLNVRELASDAQTTEKDASNWLSLLEAMGIVFFLHPYSNNQMKRTVSKPKMYFYDTGLVAFLAKWQSPDVLEAGAMNGAIFENYVISEIAKGYYANGGEPYMYYYRDKDMKEIDLILEYDGQLHPIEIKKTASPNAAMAKAFSVLSKSSTPMGMGAIICMIGEVGAINSLLLTVPAWCV
jgi:predicted AAA+ superfamily ATPase